MFDDDAEEDHAYNFMPIYSHVEEVSTCLGLSASEILASGLRRERVRDFIQLYRKTYNQDPMDADIKAHMEHRGRPYVVFSLRSAEHFKVDDFLVKKVTSVDSFDITKYN